MKKMFFILLCLILFMISISGVCASLDTNQTVDDEVSMSLDTNQMSDDEVSMSSDNDSVETSGVGTFSELQDEIRNAPAGSTINLHKDYVYDSESKYISISKALTINGNGHSIDALGQSMIFDCYNDNIVLKDIVFKNPGHGLGSAVHFSNYPTKRLISNCSVSGIFISNNGDNFSNLVYFSHNAFNCSVSGEFINNSYPKEDLVCFRFNATKCSVTGKFINNSGVSVSFNENVFDSTISGDFMNNDRISIYFHADVFNTSISGNFINGSAKYYGAAIMLWGNVFDSSISGNFSNCHAVERGGAIYCAHKFDNSRISGNFINCSSKYYGGALYLGNVTGSTISGEFINGSAGEDGGAIYLRYSADSTISGNFISNSANGIGGVIFAEKIVNSSILGNFSNNYGKFLGHAIYLGTGSSKNEISGVFINNSGFVTDDGYYGDVIDCGIVDNITVNNSVFLLDLISGNKNIGYGELCWFGNNANDFDRMPSYSAKSWLFLDSDITPRNTQGRYNMHLTLDNSFDFLSKTINHVNINDLASDVVFELSAVNVTLNKKSCRLGENVVFRFMGNKDTGSIIVKYEGISYVINVSDLVVDAPDMTKYYGGPERFTVTVKKHDEAVPGKSVSILVNGKIYYRTTDANGQVSMGINLNSGVYHVTSEVNGVKSHSTIVIMTTILADDVTKIYRNDTQYYATFIDSNGNVLKNTDVRFNINGVFYTRTTNDSGVAKLNINLNPGTYLLTAENPVTGEFQTSTVSVLSSIAENHDLTKYYRNESKYTLRILDSHGNPVGEGVSVVLNINGVFYERKTNASGYINMNINLNPGEYIVTADYNGLKASNTIKVLPVLSANDITMRYHDGTKFEATLLDGQGKAFPNQIITFNINGVLYNRTTDAKGIARLNVNLMAGEYIITSMYENGAAISNRITIMG